MNLLLAALELRFSLLAEAYWEEWIRSELRYEQFSGWLRKICQQVRRELAVATYGRVAARSVSIDLRELTKRWEDRARRAELKELERQGGHARTIQRSSSLAAKKDVGRRTKTRKKPERDFLERISPKDPNFHAKGAFLQAWADSHETVAEAFAGNISLRDYIERCIHTFSQGADIHVAFKDDSPIQERCKHIDILADKSTLLFTESLKKESRQLGQRVVKAANRQFSDRVHEVGARAKQQIFENELARHKQNAPAPARLAHDPAAQAMVLLLDKVVDRRQISIETWARDHRIPRTSLFDWKALASGKPRRGKVGDNMRERIEAAIKKDADELGLITRTDSD